MSQQPRFVYGTAWKEESTRALTELALESGFRAIDTANQRKHYHELGVGEALAASAIPREELFLQTKFTHLGGQDHRLPYDPEAPIATRVRQSMESSLEHLGVEWVDSYLLHGPTYREGLHEQDIEAWQTIGELQKGGKTKVVGVSNVSPGQLLEFIELGPKPSFVQNRCFARTGWGRRTRQVCRDQGIVYQGFSLLTANVPEIRSPEFQRLVRKYQRTPAQLVFRFAVQVGMLPLTGTTSRDHMVEDLAIFDFELPEEAVDAIENIGE